ncbi:hypothetical protein MJA45_27770 [Paenibacillus aurantius]|uniref:Uncharacterized protein n=1 Tax=Paenibacillus aurantius TaxID=2918900 RepID=A0AA96REX0_9BACL|nr:hypothetical protein [Paenibacillus aurantius]WJH36075.1 hypothetical protein N6H14_09410 [Paenibacillus sp. CC-CFT747]WNQ11352.1 hypothetical protein MJA45_27770 [Paenibacillus aurantius]
MKHQLVELVQQQTGMSAEQCEDAVNIIISYFRNRLPAETAEEINNLARGHNDGALS